MLKCSKVPNLRFGEYLESWSSKRLEEICEKTGDGLHGTPNYADNTDYYFINGNNLVDGKILISSNTKEVTYDEWIKNSKDLTNNTVLLSINGTIGNVAKYNNENVMLGKSIAYLKFKESSNFYYYLLLSDKIQNHFYSELTGTTIKNLSLKTIRETEVFFPSFPEQQKIAAFLSLINDRISTQNKIIEGLKSFKVSLRNRLFEPIPNRENEALQIKDILEYEQPTKYLVSNTNYSPDSSFTPVLTANKAFVLGYTDEGFGIYNKGECIIFDDFTMDIKYVDFPFKVKSSAIKILTPKPNVNLRFIFEYLIFLDLQAGGHKRHYISEIEPKTIALPNINKQNSMARILSTIDQKTELETSILNLLVQQKQYLLQQMFI